jgi:hypothetical protein
MAGAGAAGAALASVGLAAAAEGDLKEYIDIASFRPKPKVLIKSVVARVHPPYWLGWPGTSYDLEGHRKEYAACFADSAKRVGIELDAVEAPLESDEAVDAFVKSLGGEKPDAVLVSLQHLDSWRWADRIAKAGVPTIIFSPVGTCFTGHVAEISRRPGSTVNVARPLAIELPPAFTSTLAVCVRGNSNRPRPARVVAASPTPISRGAWDGRGVSAY